MNKESFSQQVITIKPARKFVPIDFRELWKYRELFFFLAWRNIIIRYKQTILGIAWAGIQPLVIMVVFSVVFGEVAKLPNEGIPYPLIVMIGTLPWQFFSTALTQAGVSVTGNSGMVQKIYFPRLILPFSTLVSSLVDFTITFFIATLIMLYYGVQLSTYVFYLPLFIILMLLATLALSLWFSALNVAYRDVKIMLPFILRIGLYISPVGFLSTNVPAKYQLLYSCNPLVGIIDGFRWCLLGGKISPNWYGLGISTVLVLIVLISGLYYFSKTEKSFADII